MQTTSISIYIHYPFCIAKCPYCDFNSHTNKSIDDNTALTLYKTELDYFCQFVLQNTKYTLQTIFFGGGTPSLMTPELVKSLLDYIAFKFNTPNLTDVEITLEANPSSIEASKFLQFKNAGINRISIGLQALNDNDLQVLGRVHNIKESLQAVEIAKSLFNNYSIDLIYARHKQDVQSWKNELDFACKNLAKDHISAYSLTIEKGTKYFKMHADGQIQIPNDNISEEFFNITNQMLLENGFNCYEISNYAKNDKYCRHNVVYWSGGDWLGIGAGAHGRITNSLKQRIAYNNLSLPQSYMKQILQKSHAIQDLQVLNAEQLSQELTIMNLRYKGLDIDFIKQKFDIDILNFLNHKKLKQFCDDDFLTHKNNVISATTSGKKILNSIISSILL